MTCLQLFIFFYSMTRYISRLVLGHVTFLLNDLLHPPGLTLHQRPQVFRVSHPIKPEHFDGLLQLGDAGEELAVELLLHPNPAILNRVKVRRVTTAPEPPFFPARSTCFALIWVDRKNRDLKLASTGKF